MSKISILESSFFLSLSHCLHCSSDSLSSFIFCSLNSMIFLNSLITSLYKNPAHLFLSDCCFMGNRNNKVFFWWKRHMYSTLFSISAVTEHTVHCDGIMSINSLWNCWGVNDDSSLYFFNKNFWYDRFSSLYGPLLSSFSPSSLLLCWSLSLDLFDVEIFWGHFLYFKGNSVVFSFKFTIKSLFTASALVISVIFKILNDNDEYYPTAIINIL